MKEMYSLSLIILACILGYGYEWKQPAVLCCIAAAFYSVQVIREGFGDLYYGQLVGELDEYGDKT